MSCASLRESEIYIFQAWLNVPDASNRYRVCDEPLHDVVAPYLEGKELAMDYMTKEEFDAFCIDEAGPVSKEAWDSLGTRLKKPASDRVQEIFVRRVTNGE